jgi:hypothetical protein
MAQMPHFSISATDYGYCEIKCTMSNGTANGTLKYTFNSKEELDKLISRLVALRNLMDGVKEKLTPAPQK